MSVCWAHLLWACLTGAAAQPPWVGVSLEPRPPPASSRLSHPWPPRSPSCGLMHRQLVLDLVARCRKLESPHVGNIWGPHPTEPHLAGRLGTRASGRLARPRQEGGFWVAWGRAGPQGCGSPSHPGFFTETTAFWVPVCGPRRPQGHTLFSVQVMKKKCN